jgi:D-alanyl-D-alanine carboxypeptidase
MRSNLIVALFALFSILSTGAAAHAEWSGSTSINAEDTEEFLFADDPAVPDLGKPELELQPTPTPEALNSTRTLDDLLTSQGQWSYQFVYYPQEGEPQVLKMVRSDELVKPASLLKLFTGWMAFEKKALAIPTLSEMLKDSNNYIADTTFKQMGAQKSFKSFYQRELALKLDPKTAQIYNGSGLPVYLNQKGKRVKFNSWMKASFIPELLEHILKSEEYPEFKLTLATPGGPGTLRERFLDLNFPMYAKTGTLNRVANLAGFIELPKGTIVFSVVSDELESVRNGREQIAELVKYYIGVAEQAQQLLDVNPVLLFPTFFHFFHQ